MLHSDFQSLRSQMAEVCEDGPIVLPKQVAILAVDYVTGAIHRTFTMERHTGVLRLCDCLHCKQADVIARNAPVRREPDQIRMRLRLAVIAVL